MKNKKITLITNLLLVIILVSIFTIGVKSERSVTILGSDISGAIYHGDEDCGGVALMFNVYENSEVVEDIIKLLNEQNATATFFVGGCWADDNTKILKDILDCNFELGNHGYFHKDQDKLDFTQNRKEIADCNKFIELAIGEKPSLFAPPSGAYNVHTLSAAKFLGVKTILWSKDTIDWRDKNAALIYSRATKNIKSGDFILMHPIKETADALPDILKFYQKNGLKSVTVSQNLQKEG